MEYFHRSHLITVPQVVFYKPILVALLNLLFCFGWRLFLIASGLFFWLVAFSFG